MKRKRRYSIKLLGAITNGLLAISIPIMNAGEMLGAGLEISLLAFSLKLLGTFCLGFAWMLLWDSRNT